VVDHQVFTAIVVEIAVPSHLNHVGVCRDLMRRERNLSERRDWEKRAAQEQG
jgi:hypothetical protein